MPYIHLIEGPVGSGKSTFAANLSQDLKIPRLNLDDWMATLFSPDRPSSNVIPWYSNRKGRCIEQIWKMASSIIESDNDVILELGLIQQQSRTGFLEKVENSGYQLNVYVLDAPRELRRERVTKRNQEKGETFSMEVPDNIFELASDMWEPIEAFEFSGHKVKFINYED